MKPKQIEKLQKLSPNHYQYNDFDFDALTASKAIHASLRITPNQLSAEAFIMNTYLTTWWNAQSATGAVHPSYNRIQKSLGLSIEQQQKAMQELEAMGWWRVVNTRNQTEYKFLLASRADEVRRELSVGGISMNHVKYIVRYTSCSPMAKALMLMVLSKCKQFVVNLEYTSWINAGRYGRRTKLFHGTLFRSPVLDSINPAKSDLIVKTTVLPEEWTKDSPIRASVSLDEFNKKVNCSRGEWTDAVREIQALGFWTTSVDPFSDTYEAVFTPTYRLHRDVWSFDQISGGKGISEWETRNGWNDSTPDLENDLPTLGYHWIYTLRQSSTGAVLMVGQTTQPLQQRLNQHLVEATNSDAMQVIRNIVRDPFDGIEIVKEAEVHFFEVAQQEVEMMTYYTTLGHQLLNKIRTVEVNRLTIKPDSRFGADGVSWKQLQEILDSHGGTAVFDRAA